MNLYCLKLNSKSHFFLKKNKSNGYNRISFNVIKFSSGPLIKTLTNIFNLSLPRGMFPYDLKIA